MSDEERADTLVDERELAAALRELRADPASFREAVERRIREAEAKTDGASGDARELRAEGGSWWRRAAAWLPGELVPGSLAAGGAKLSWKVIGGLLALPALTFAMLTMPLFLAFQGMASRADERVQERLAIVRAWWREHRRAALVTLTFIGLVFLVEPASAGVALLLVSTGVLAMLLSRLRAAGFGRRVDVARHCANLLFSLCIWMGIVFGPWQALFPSENSRALGVCALSIAGVVCGVTALRANHPTLWHLVTRAKTSDAVMLLFIAGFVPVSAMTLSAAVGRLDRVDWRQSLEQLHPYSGRDWERPRKSVAFLLRDGVKPDLAGMRAHWLELRSRWDLERDQELISAGIDLGFVEPDELAERASAARSLLLEDGPLSGGSLRERADLLALARCGTLTPEEREHLGRRLLASRDGGANPWVIERLVTVASLLDGLGFSARADELRPDAFALLRECWIPDEGILFSDAGFHAQRWEVSDRGFPPNTLDAIDLMRRFGVPAEIDLASVRRGLRSSVRRAFPWEKPNELHWEAQLALFELEELLPRSGWLGSLSENRMLLAMIVLATFCVVATLRAPRDPLVRSADERR